MRFPMTKRDFEIDVMKAYCDGFMTACNQDVGDVRSQMLSCAGGFCKDNVFRFIGRDNLPDFVKKHFGM